MLRSQWHGRVVWHNTTLCFRLLYIMVQFLMTPWWVFQYYCRLFINDFGINEKYIKRVGLSYFTGPANLDEPINRF